MKGTISNNLLAILQNDEGRKQLRRSLLKGTDGKVTVGSTHYRVSTKSPGSGTVRERSIEKSTFRRKLDSLKRNVG